MLQNLGGRGILSLGRGAALQRAFQSQKSAVGTSEASAPSASATLRPPMPLGLYLSALVHLPNPFRDPQLISAKSIANPQLQECQVHQLLCRRLVPQPRSRWLVPETTGIQRRTHVRVRFDLFS